MTPEAPEGAVAVTSPMHVTTGAAESSDEDELLKHSIFSLAGFGLFCKYPVLCCA